nr:MAG TPA: hypothetical protein [Caudoviricetes sp.]
MENTLTGYQSSPLTVGSPPHTWRILCLVSRALQDDRITSTLVENTLNDPRYINIPQSK